MEGRIALVTGASSGIGYALCRHLASCGMRVFGCAREIHKIEEMAQENRFIGTKGSITAIKCDLRVEEEILNMFSIIRQCSGTLHLCINNAGLSFDATLMAGATEQWRNVIDVNVLALCICSREAIKLMKESGVNEEGRIIHISSMSGHRIPEVETAQMYVGTKHMVRALAEGLRRELRAQGSLIRVACVSPGVVETEFEYRCFVDRPEIARGIYHSMKCLQSDDIIQAVHYILSCPNHVDVSDILIRPTDQEV